MTNELFDLTPDEARVLHEHRAMKSIREKPTDRSAILLHLIVAMRHLASIGMHLDPHDGMWQKISEVLPGIKP